MQQRHYKNELGLGKLTFLVFGTIIFAACYYVYHVLPFYYGFYEFQNQIEAAAKVAATDNDQIIRRKLLHTIKELHLPVDPDDLIIQRNGNHIKIALSYREVFYITFREKDYVIQTFDFDAQAEETF